MYLSCNALVNRKRKYFLKDQDYEKFFDYILRQRNFKLHENFFALFIIQNALKNLYLESYKTCSFRSECESLYSLTFYSHNTQEILIEEAIFNYIGE